MPKYPFKRHAQWLESQPLPDLLREEIKHKVGPDGVWPQHLFWRRGRVRHEELKVPGGLVIDRALELLLNGHGADEIILGVDIDVDEPMGLPYRRGVAVAHWRDHRWFCGVLSYRWMPVVVTPIDWFNQVAISRMHGLIQTQLRKRQTGKIYSVNE